jgi:hypothetical protein
VPTPTHYQFEARRFYADDERYCSGSGLSFFTEDLEHAKRVFETYRSDRQGETYSVSVTRADTGEVLMHVGPSIKEAECSMNRAWARRYKGN